MKLIQYFERSHKYRVLEMFDSPYPGRTNLDLLNNWGLLSYQRTSEKPDSWTYRCDIFGRSNSKPIQISYPYSNTSVTVDPAAKSDHREPVDALDPADKKLVVKYGGYTDHLYQYLHSETGREHIKVQNIVLKDFSASLEDGRMVYRHGAEVTWLWTKEPFPDDIEETMKGTQERRTVVTKSTRPAFVPFFIIDPDLIDPALYLCDASGVEDGRYPARVFRPRGTEAFLGPDLKCTVKRMFVRQEDESQKKEGEQNRYGFYLLAEYAEDSPILENTPPEAGRVFYADGAMLGELNGPSLSATLQLPRYIKDYFHSLQFEFLQERIEMYLRPRQLSLAGFSPLNVVRDDDGKWKYRVSVLAIRGTPFSVPSFYSAEGVEYLDIIFESEFPLITNLDLDDDLRKAWVVPGTREIERMRLVAGIKREIQNQRITELSPQYQDAFLALSSELDDHLQDAALVGDALDQLDGADQDRLRALGYVR